MNKLIPFILFSQEARAGFLFIKISKHVPNSKRIVLLSKGDPNSKSQKLNAIIPYRQLLPKKKQGDPESTFALQKHS
jgi:hypothetical protein